MRHFESFLFSICNTYSVPFFLMVNVALYSDQHNDSGEVCVGKSVRMLITIASFFVGIVLHGFFRVTPHASRTHIDIVSMMGTLPVLVCFGMNLVFSMVGHRAVVLLACVLFGVISSTRFRFHHSLSYETVVFCCIFTAVAFICHVYSLIKPLADVHDKHYTATCSTERAVVGLIGVSLLHGISLARFYPQMSFGLRLMGLLITLPPFIIQAAFPTRAWVPTLLDGTISIFYESGISNSEAFLMTFQTCVVFFSVVFETWLIFHALVQNTQEIVEYWFVLLISCIIVAAFLLNFTAHDLCILYFIIPVLLSLGRWLSYWVL
jgi:hypothetical protein